LRAYYADKLDLVCDDCLGRYERNPMRLLDCKQDRCQPVIAGAPVITEYLCQPCREHFAQVQIYLARLEVGFELNPRLVRGLDYYTRTVFEFQPLIEGSQSSIGGGGRYDGLIELLGGRHTPGVGFGCGIERTIINVKRAEVPVGDVPRPVLYVAHTGSDSEAAALSLVKKARVAGVSAIVAGAGKSLKAQLRHASASGARFAAIIGERELSEGIVTLRDLDAGTQETLSTEDAIPRLPQG